MPAAHPQETLSETSFDRRLQVLTTVLKEMQVHSFTGNEHLERWLAALPQLAATRRSFNLPLTCIGPVKSGKSTLLNTLAGAELLPTGAGITTSFPTTVLGGQKFTARFTLLPEKRISEIFSRAAVLLFGDDFPDRSPEWKDDRDVSLIESRLKMRREKKTLTRQGIFDESYRLLRNLIHGRERVLPRYRQKGLELCFDHPEDKLYRAFIQDEGLAVYLQEIVIQAPLKHLPPHFSLRDLPGLDTPNPSHQSLIFEQLAASPALIYVLSSRIGLRQADCQLLEHLRELGLDAKLFFVLNLDLDGHRDRHALEEMRNRCRNELNELGFPQPLYPFSALALGWKLRATELDEYERRRLENWRKEPGKMAFSDTGAHEFFTRLAALGRNQAATALLEHSEKRLQQIQAGCRRLLLQRLRELAPAEDAAGTRSDNQKETISALKEEAERILKGVKSDLERHAFQAVDNWIAQRNSTSLREELRKIVNNYRPPLEQIPGKYRNPLTPVKVVREHFELTIPPRLKERVAFRSQHFLDKLQLDLNRRFQTGCLPLLLIGERISGLPLSPEELPLPVRIDVPLPAFVLYSEVERKFALLSRLREIMRLWGSRLKCWKKDSLEHSFTAQLKQETVRELPRWLSNFAEQLKYTLLRPYLENCEKLSREFFQDLLAGAESTLREGSKRRTVRLQETAAERAALQSLLEKLEQLSYRPEPE